MTCTQIANVDSLMYTHSMETIYLSLCAQEAVSTFFVKSPVYIFLCRPLQLSSLSEELWYNNWCKTESARNKQYEYSFQCTNYFNAHLNSVHIFFVSNSFGPKSVGPIICPHFICTGSLCLVSLDKILSYLQCCNTNLETTILNLNILDNKNIHQAPIISAVALTIMGRATSRIKISTRVDSFRPAGWRNKWISNLKHLCLSKTFKQASKLWVRYVMLVMCLLTDWLID